jgi:hypothetical protein
MAINLWPCHNNIQYNVAYTPSRCNDIFYFYDNGCIYDCIMAISQCKDKETEE